MRNALSVASECAPLIKTGGLADVAGALPAALAPQGWRLRTLLPGYPAVMARLQEDNRGSRRGRPDGRSGAIFWRQRRRASICSFSTRRISMTGEGSRSISGRTARTGPTIPSVSPRSAGWSRLGSLPKAWRWLAA
jgi:hypothetical protein